MFSKPVTDLIRQRWSIRTYNGAPLGADLEQRLQAFLAANTTGPFGTQVRFSLITATDQDREAVNNLSTYGFIRNPAGFMVGAVERGPYALEDYGYLMQKNVLMATDLGLGTCWLGGTFSQSGFARHITLRDNEMIAAISPVGHQGDMRTFDSIARWSVGAAKRKPWEELFFADRGPLSRTEAGEYAEALEMVRLAPSAANKQPWRILKQGHTFHFFMKRNSTFLIRMPNKADMQRVDMGIAMCHFDLTVPSRETGAWHVDQIRGSHPLGEYRFSWLG
ncbi:MAG TPA: nitroreductase family protein [bacterium]|nr:nitroreductase family protein [bacterium]